VTGRLAVLMVAGFAGMIGCAADPVLPLPVGPADPNAIIDRTQITAEPNQVAPGDIVALRFPDEMIRGVWFVLEERVDDTWIHRYNLTSEDQVRSGSASGTCRTTCRSTSPISA
jgi:hypothetical protein